MKRRITAALAALLILGSSIPCGGLAVQAEGEEKKETIVLEFDQSGELLTDPSELGLLAGTEEITWKYQEAEGRLQIMIIPEEGFYADYSDTDYEVVQTLRLGEEDGRWRTEILLETSGILDGADTADGHTLTLSMKKDGEAPVIENVTGEQADDGSWVSGAYTIRFQVTDGTDAAASGAGLVIFSRSENVLPGESVPEGEASYQEIKYNETDRCYELQIPGEDYAGSGYITAYDRAGNYTRREVKIRCEVNGPVIRELSRTPDTEWTNQETEVQFRVETPVSGIKKVSYRSDAGGSAGTELTADENGVYHFTVPKEERETTWTIQAESNAGKTDTETVTTRIDLTRPATPQISASGDGVISLKREITLTITAEDVPGETSGIASGIDKVYVETVLKDDGSLEEIGEASKNTDGSYTFKIKRSLFINSVQNKAFYIYAVDAAGNVSAPALYTADIDLEQPVIEKMEITDIDGNALKEYEALQDQAFGVRPVRITVTASDDRYGSGLASVSLYRKEGERYTELASPVIPENGKAVFTVPAEDITEGDTLAFEDVIYAQAADQAGNTSDYSGSGTVVLENTKPRIFIEKSESPDTMITVDGVEYPCYRDDTGLNITVSDDRGGVNSGIHKLRVRVNGQVLANQTFSSRENSKILTVSTEDCVIADDGSYQVIVEAEDFSGNTETEEFRLYKDNTPPRITQITKDPASDWSGGDVTVTIEADDISGRCSSGVAQVRYGTGGYEDSMPASIMGEGTYQFTVSEESSAIYSIWVEDRAGNRSDPDSKDQVQVRVDKTAPVIQQITFEGTGYQEGDGEALADVMTQTDYGYYFRSDVLAAVTAKDTQYQRTEDGQETEIEGSGVSEVYYILASSDGGASQPQRAEAGDNGVFTFLIEAGFKGDVYVMAKDCVGNRPEDDPETEADEGYVHGEGIVLETGEQHAENGKAEITLPGTDLISAKGQNLYGEDIEVRLHAADPDSGIRAVEWQVQTPFDENAYQAGTVNIDGEGVMTGDTEGWSAAASDRNLITAMNLTLPVSADSCDITVMQRMTDRAGNTTTSRQTFDIDKSAPVIEVSYDNNEYDEGFISEGEYYNADRTAVITIRERNFDAENTALTVTRDGENVRMEEVEWEGTADGDNPDNTTHTTRVLFDRDGDYTFRITSRDLAGNEAQTYGPDQFVIDKTAPSLRVEYDNTDGQNGNYYNAPRTAVITIEEHNFETSRFSLSGEASYEGTALAYPSLSEWSSSGDTHTAAIHFQAEGDYSFRVAYTDKAGNQASEYPEDTFVLDYTAPELAIEDLENQSANAAAVRPVVSWSDINLESPAEITLTGSNRGETDLMGGYYGEEEEGFFQFDNFPFEKEYDDIYTMQATVSDLAGNESSETIRFSVNRFGSVYTFSPQFEDINGKFLQKETDLIITETNVDQLDPDSIEIKVAKNGQNTNVSENGCDITESGGGGSWSQYTYRLKASNFAEEGIYTVTVNSVDGAGNINDSTDETKEAEIRFGIDKSAPRIIAVNVEDGETYAEDSKTAEFAVEDNLILEDVTVSVNGEDAPLTVQDNRYTFELANSDTPQKIVVTALDAAGNRSEYTVSDFYVTQNLFIRWYTNRPLMIGTIAGVILIAAGGVSAVLVRRNIRKRRRREPEQERT